MQVYNSATVSIDRYESGELAMLLLLSEQWVRQSH